jgi:hypothetical protein
MLLFGHNAELFTGTLANKRYESLFPCTIKVSTVELDFFLDPFGESLASGETLASAFGGETLASAFGGETLASAFGGETLASAFGETLDLARREEDEGDFDLARRDVFDSAFGSAFDSPLGSQRFVSLL